MLQEELVERNARTKKTVSLHNALNTRKIIDAPTLVDKVQNL